MPSASARDEIAWLDCDRLEWSGSPMRAPEFFAVPLIEMPRLNTGNPPSINSSVSRTEPLVIRPAMPRALAASIRMPPHCPASVIAAAIDDKHVAWLGQIKRLVKRQIVTGRHLDRQHRVRRATSRDR